MLQSIRDHTHGWIAGVIVSLLIFSFALWGIHSYFLSAGNNNIVAKVNGTQITRNQLSVAYERLVRQLQMQAGSNQLPQKVEANLKDQALQTLINFRVLEQASFKQDYRVTSNQVDGFLQSMPDFQVGGMFSATRFQQLLSATMFSVPDFIELIRTTLLIDQPRLGIIFTSFAMPDEISDTIALIGQERDLRYLVIPQAYFAHQPVTISKQSVEAYYAKHQEQFKTPEQVSIEYIQLSAQDLANKINPSEKELKNFYNENNASFAQPATWQLDEIIIPLSAKEKLEEIAKAAKNTDFSTLVKRYSLIKGDEKLHVSQSINQIPVELQKTVSTLTQLGQISTPIPTPKGWGLLRVIAYRPAAAQPYSKVKDKVRQAFASQKAEEVLADKREKMANLTYEHPDSLQVAAKELGLPINTTELFTKEKSDNHSVVANEKIREIAFGNDVLNLQNNSDVIPLTPESFIVLRVKKHIPAAVLPLNAVQHSIEEKLKTAVLEDNLTKLANDLKNKLQTGELTPDQVSSQYHFSWQKSGFVGRHVSKIDQAILNSAFAMPLSASNDKITYTTTRVANGFAIVGLLNVRQGNINVTPEQYHAFADQIQNSLGALEYQLYKDSLINSAKIIVEN